MDPEALNPATNRDITLNANGNITFTAGIGAVADGGHESWAQVGNGGAHSNIRTPGTGWNGDISVTSATGSFDSGM